MHQHGAKVLTLTSVVDNLMAMEGNSKRQHYMSTMIHAKWAWKDLLRSTVYSISHYVVPVENGRAVMPTGIGDVLKISMVDRYNNRQPLAYNSAINTINLKSHAKLSCNCKCKGEQTLCALVEDIVYRTEDIQVDGETMQKRIWNRVDPCGVLYEVIEVPVYDPSQEKVITTRIETKLCPIDVTEDGCVTDTPENAAKLYDNCGCYMLHADRYNQTATRVPTGHSRWGEWNWEDGDKRVIHLRDSPATQLIVTAFADGECEGEMMVPEFAVRALHMGILYSRAIYAPAGLMAANALLQRERTYKQFKAKLEEYLTPIDLDAMAEISAIIPKWG